MITIKVDSKIVRDHLGKIITNLPRAAGKDAKAIAKVFRAAIRSSILSRGLTWNMQLFNQTQTRKMKGGYSISMPLHGLWHEYGSAHFVSPFKHPELGAWAQQKLGFIPRVIWVKPKRFAGFAIREATTKLKPIINKGQVSKLVLGR